MKRNQISWVEFVNKNRLLVSLFVILILGILVGSLTYRSFTSEETSSLSFLAQGFMEDRVSKTPSQILTNSFVSATVVMGITFISGFCAISQPFQMLIPFIKGLGLGASVAQIYVIKGGSGLIIVLLLIIPYSAIICFAYLIAVKESVKYSAAFFRLAFFAGHNEGMRAVTKNYCIKYLILEIIVAISAVIDSVSTFLFADLLLK